MRVLFLNRVGTQGGTLQSLKTLRSWLSCESDIYEVNYRWRPHPRKCWLTFPLFMLSGWWLELKAIRKAEQKYDILHCAYEGVIWYAIGSNLPVVCHVRTIWPTNIWGWLFKKLVLRVADAVICISANEYKQVGGYIVPNIAFCKDE